MGVKNVDPDAPFSDDDALGAHGRFWSARIDLDALLL
jgi:hypothetical protein|tara:strand:+ start:30493 stop:30603 length:111 start_codon:yes stop_codon:yes gene_type:complete